MRYGEAVVLLHVVSIAEGQATPSGMLLSWQRERKMADHAMALKAYTWTRLYHVCSHLGQNRSYSQWGGGHRRGTLQDESHTEEL